MYLIEKAPTAPLCCNKSGESLGMGASGFSRRAGDRRFSPCTKVYHAGYKFWIHFIFGTTLNVSTKETKRFLLSAYKVLCKCRICSYKCCRFSKFPGGACSRTLLDDPPITSILSPPTMPHLGEPWALTLLGTL